MPDPYISEVKFLGGPALDFIEIAVDAGSDIRDLQVIVHNPNGTVRTVNVLGSAVDTVAGRDIYVIDTATSGTFDGLNRNGAVALVNNNSVVSFLSFDSAVTATEGPATGQPATQLGTTGRGASLETTDRGGSYQVQSNPNAGAIPCFLSGVQIDTPTGVQPIEDIRAGDRVLTLDSGVQTVLWAGSRTIGIDEMTNPATRPLRVPAHAMGEGLPARDLYLSRNHRVLLSHPHAALYFRDFDVLAPVKGLCGARGIGMAPVALPIRYHHILLARHHIVFANALPCETFLPEAVGRAGFGTDRQLLKTLMDLEQKAGGYGQTARSVLKSSETRLLIQSVGNAPVARSYRRARFSAAA